ncbi:hypothetical protein [Streptosporangium subroseum]|uniref:hypothetical protein n=1 Tax=Streptosporangium subroseum TaxID=106412 RepID=UPI00308D7AC7|nr:hypothetical protein OHB15_49140 [Streptosporangium subroseum]
MPIMESVRRDDLLPPGDFGVRFGTSPGIFCGHNAPLAKRSPILDLTTKGAIEEPVGFLEENRIRFAETWSTLVRVVRPG